MVVEVASPRGGGLPPARSEHAQRAQRAGLGRPGGAQALAPSTRPVVGNPPNGLDETAPQVPHVPIPTLGEMVEGFKRTLAWLTGAPSTPAPPQATKPAVQTTDAQGASPATHARLKTATLSLHEALAAHELELGALKVVTEGLVQAMAEEVSRQRGGGRSYGAHGGVEAAGGPTPALVDRSA